MRIAGLVVLCAVAAKIRSATFHGLFVLGALLFEVSFFVRNFFSLS
jgi:hypothetical protein